MRKRYRKRILAYLLAAVILVTSVPFQQTAEAANNISDVTLQLYDYTQLWSLVSPYRAMAVENRADEQEIKYHIYSPMYAGELSYVKFALPYNMPVKLEIYAGGKRLGPMAGMRYTRHVDGNMGGFTARSGYEAASVVRADMEELYTERCEAADSLTGMFYPLEIVAGIGLTGQPLAYRTLRGYYEYHNLEYPFDLPADSISGNDPDAGGIFGSVPENESEAETKEELTEDTTEELTEDTTEELTEDTTEEPVKESGFEFYALSVPGKEAAGPERGPAEKETSRQETSEEGKKDSGEDTEEKISGEKETGQEDVSKEEVSEERETAEGKDSEKTEAEGTSEKETSETETSEEETSEVETEQENSSEAKENGPSEFSKEELMEKYYLSEEEAGFFTEEDWEELRRIAAGSELSEGIKEEEIPDGFYITSPDFESIRLSDLLRRTAFLSAEEGEYGASVSGILHNYMIWRGQYYDEVRGENRYIPEGEFEIRISPLSESVPLDEVRVLHAVMQYPVSADGDTIDPNTATDEQLQAILQAIRENPKSARDGFLTVPLPTDGDPVNMISGALDWSYTDLSIEGQKPLAFIRTYLSNRRENDSAGLGYGWSHNWNYKADIFMGNVLIDLPGGGRIFFTLDSRGGYETNKGNVYGLEKTGDGYRLTNTATAAVITFDNDGNARRLAESDGTVTEFTCDGNKLVKVANDTGSLTFSWNGNHMDSVKDSAGRTIRFTVEDGDLVKAENADGDVLSYTYDSHKLLDVTDYNGVLMLRNSYDSEGRVAEQIMPDRGRMIYSYDEVSRRNTYTEEGGTVRITAYDDKLRVTRITDESGSRGYTYDDLSRLSSETDQNGNTTSYTYLGDSSRLESVLYPDGTREHYDYAQGQMVASFTRQDGVTLSYTYENGKLVSCVDGKGGVTRYAYDARGYLKESTDALGHTTVYTTDDKGNITSSTDPLGSTNRYEYDSAGRLTKQTSPLGHVYMLDGTFQSPPTAHFRIFQIENSGRIASRKQISVAVSSLYRIRSMTGCWPPQG